MHPKAYNHLRNRTKVTLTLGEEYVLYNWGRPYVCKFIQVTPKGYNFLVLDKSVCLLRRHLYPTKDDPTKFYISRFFSILKIKDLEKTKQS